MPEVICPWGNRVYGSIKRKTDSRMHFSLLPDNLKKSYLQIVGTCYENQSEVYIDNCLSRQQLEKLYLSIMYDNPSLVREPVFSYMSTPNRTKVIIHYKIPERSADMIIRKANEICDNIAKMTFGFSEYQKELFVHDYLVRNTIYDLNMKNHFSMNSVIMDCKGVCAGISLANSYILNSLGIDTSVVRGSVHGTQLKHAWNIVNLDGENYHEDVTFDLNNKIHISHRYLNFDDNMMCIDRTCENNITCNGRTHRFHR